MILLAPTMLPVKQVDRMRNDLWVDGARSKSMPSAINVYLCRRSGHYPRAAIGLSGQTLHLHGHVHIGSVQRPVIKDVPFEEGIHRRGIPGEIKTGASCIDGNVPCDHVIKIHQRTVKRGGVSRARVGNDKVGKDATQTECLRRARSGITQLHGGAP